ncbi:MAG: alanine:cation symporter family protein [Arsenophonus sp.]
MRLVCKKLLVGVVGYGVDQEMVEWIRRGLFSNYAEWVIAPHASASASPYPLHHASQEYMQIIGFIYTLVIYSATAIIIISSGELNSTEHIISGIELTQRAFSLSVSNLGKIFIVISTFFFAFTSIIANSTYVESGIVFFKK